MRGENPLKQSILVIDDVADNVLLLQDQLEDDGYEVLTAASGEEGLRVATDKRPDLVLLDIMMPGMDGFTVLQKLRGQPETRDLPVLMVSALDDAESITKGLDSGAQDYLVKPFNLEIVQARVRTALRNKTGLDALRVMNRHLDASNARLLESNGQLEQFNSFVSHDLKEPLRKLSMFSELLRKDLGEGLSPAVVADLDEIAAATLRMQALIDDLLQLSRVRGDALQESEILLDHCVDQAVEGLSLLLEDRRVQVRYENLPQVVGDAFLLTQVFTNLISNAAKYGAPAGGIVRITVEERGEDWVLGVADNGPGVPEPEREKVLLPFERLQAGSDAQGTGIGLAICQKAVERLGGDLWIEDAEPQGAHFRFTLPRY